MTPAELDHRLMRFRDHCIQAGEIRPGDSDRFKLLIINNEQRWTDEQWQKSMDMLRRYQRMAERMHD